LAAERGWLAAGAELPDDEAIATAIGAPRRASSTVSGLEPHRDRIAAWLEQGVAGTAILAALKRNHGYTGSYSSLYRMMASIQTSRPPEATMRLEFAPAEAAQVDFGAGPILRDDAGVKRRTWAFVMTLCFSRHQYVEFVWDQTVATWLGCHRRAFEWFGAVPGRLIIDNPKCAITRACIRDPEVQRAYAECAEGYGFKIDPCPPADPQKKGIVESGVKYVKGNFVPLRAFRDLADLNAQARQWVTNEAGVRIHGTTRRPPLELFELERALMQPLPAIAPDLGSWHRVLVHRDCHVAHERVLYSVPFALVRQRLWLRVTDGSVSMYPPASASPCAITCRPRPASSSRATAPGASSRRSASAWRAPSSSPRCSRTACWSDCAPPRASSRFVTPTAPIASRPPAPVPCCTPAPSTAPSRRSSPAASTGSPWSPTSTTATPRARASPARPLACSTPPIPPCVADPKEPCP